MAFIYERVRRLEISDISSSSKMSVIQTNSFDCYSKANYFVTNNFVENGQPWYTWCSCAFSVVRKPYANPKPEVSGIGSECHFTHPWTRWELPLPACPTQTPVWQLHK